MSTIVITPAIKEPISIEEARAQLRLEPGEDDDHLYRLIPMARTCVESYCNRFFTEQTVLIVCDTGFDGKKMILPYPDLQTVDAVNIFVDGIETEVTGYTFNSQLRTIFFDENIIAESITVQVVTGVPVEFEGARSAMLMVMTDLYEHRSENMANVTISTNPAVVNLMYPYRVNIGV